MSKLAFGYGRVSTTGQVEDGASLEAQEERFHEWCRHHGYAPAGFYSDPGKSGKRMDNRPGLLAVLKAVTDASGVLVVYSLSRMARSTRNALDIGDYLQKGGADLVSLSEHIDTTTPFGEFFFTMMAAMAQLDRDIIARNTKNSLRFLLENGEAHCNAKYGWRKVQDGEVVRRKRKQGGPVMWEPVQQEQEALARMEELRSLGWSYRDVADYLNNEDVPSPRGTKWHSTSVRSVLLTARKMPGNRSELSSGKWPLNLTLSSRNTTRKIGVIQHSIGRDAAIALGKDRWWEGKTAREIAEFQIHTEELCCPFSVYQRAMSEALGREVFTHEFGSEGTARMQVELRGDAPSPSLQDIINLIPEEKRVLVVTDSEDP